MKYVKAFIVVFFLASNSEAFAQTQRTSGFSGTGANYDVIFQRCHWRINPDSSVKYIKGIVDFKFVTTSNNVTTISFDLRNSLTINSIKFRGTTLPIGSIARASNKVTVTLGLTLLNNQIDSLTIDYEGTPPNASGAAQGYQVGTSTVSGFTSDNYISTLSESYEDRDWWPCKADMQDKIDSMEINVSVPWSGADTFWVATNGHLYDSTISVNNRVFKTKIKYPIASYLVAVCVAKYTRLYSSVTLPSGFVLKGHFYVFRGRTNAEMDVIKNNIAAQNNLVYALSQKLGDYPFKNEKYGFYEGIDGAGGMEHQGFYGMATASLNSQATLAHELTHQWFGDKVTFKTWADLWLAEGFARYGEALAGELAPATGISFASELSSARSTAFSLGNSATVSTAQTTVKLPNISSSTNIWTTNNTRAIYDKGCMIVSMLRNLSGNEKFYEALQIYLNQSAPYSSANTDTLKNVFTRVLGYDMTAFFDAYVNKHGHPTIRLRWGNPAGNILTLAPGTQTRSTYSNVSYFPTPFVVRVQGANAGEDTTLVFYDVNGSTLVKAGNGLFSETTNGILYYNLLFKPVTVTLDPNRLNLVAIPTSGSVTFESALNVSIQSFTGVKLQNGNNIKLLLSGASQSRDVTIERSEGQLTNFKTLGKMKFNNGSTLNDGSEFYFDDVAPQATINYYRCFYKDDLDNTKYSKIIALENIKQTNTSGIDVVALNDNNTISINVKHRVWLNEPVAIEIFTNDGRLVQSMQLMLNFGTNIVAIKQLSTGVYFLTAQNRNTALHTSKFVK